MGILSSHESFVHDIKIRHCDILDVKPNGITFADDSYMRNLSFVDDKREKFYELANDASEQGRNIYLRCHENVIYGMSDNDQTGSWHMSGCLSPTSFGWVKIGN